MSPLNIELRMTSNNFWVVVGVKDKNISELDIPDEVDGLWVESIADNAFAGNKQLRYVNLPDTISFIGENAFRNCVNLKEVCRYYSPDIELVIGARAFQGCFSLSKVYLNNISELGEQAFQFCGSLERFPFADCKNLTTFNKETFAHTGIQSITLYTQQIHPEAFKNTNPNRVYIRGNPTFSAEFIETIQDATVFAAPNSSYMELCHYGILVRPL